MPLKRIVVLFNLRPGKTAVDYENWARTRDLPTVNALPSIHRFEVFRSIGLLGGAGQPPYAYIEILDIEDMDLFGGDVSTPTMQKVAAEFQSWADPVFILTESIEQAPPNAG